MRKVIANFWFLFEIQSVIILDSADTGIYVD